MTRVGTVALGRPCRATLGFFRGRAALDGFSVGLMDAARRRVVGRGAQLSIPLHEKGCPMVSRSLRNVGFHGPNPSVDFADSLHPVVILSEATASRMRSSRAVEGSLPACSDADPAGSFHHCSRLRRENSLSRHRQLPACKGSFDSVVARFATANSAQDDRTGRRAKSAAYPWKPESESNSKPPAPAASRKCCSACWQLLQFCHPERSDCFALREAAAQSKDPYPRAVTPTPQGVSTTAPDCAARTPSVVIVSPAFKGSFDCVVARFATANSAQDDKRGACTRVKTALGL